MIGQTGELLGHNMFAYCKNNPINRKDDHGFRSSGVIDECGGIGEPLKRLEEVDLVIDLYNAKGTSGNVRKVRSGTKAHTGKMMIYGKEMTDEFMTRGQFVAKEIANAAKDSFNKQAIASKIASGFSNYIEIGQFNKQFFAGWAIDAITGVIIGLGATALS